MIAADTSVLIAAALEPHEHHRLARSAARRASCHDLLAIEA
jgi:predicted nucleic acid-binding protein